jgi:urea transporter
MFRALVVGSLALGMLGAVVDVMFPGLIPEELREAESDLTDELSTIPTMLAGGSAVAALVLGVVSAIGPLMFRRWGRTLALVATAAGLAAYPFIGYVLMSGVGLGLYELSSVMWGAVLALAYCSTISDRFDAS